MTPLNTKHVLIQLNENLIGSPLPSVDDPQNTSWILRGRMKYIVGDEEQYLVHEEHLHFMVTHLELTLSNISPEAL